MILNHEIGSNIKYIFWSDGMANISGPFALSLNIEEENLLWKFMSIIWNVFWLGVKKYIA